MLFLLVNRFSTFSGMSTDIKNDDNITLVKACLHRLCNLFETKKKTEIAQRLQRSR